MYNMQLETTNLMIGETVKFAPLKACPKCGYPGGLIYCLVCHSHRAKNPLGGIFVKDAATQEAEHAAKQKELADDAARHRKRTSLDSFQTDQPVPSAAKPKTATKSKTATAKSKTATAKSKTASKTVKSKTASKTVKK